MSLFTSSFIHLCFVSSLVVYVQCIPGVHAATPTYVVQQFVDYPGNDIFSTPTSYTPAECKAFCDNNDECNVYETCFPSTCFAKYSTGGRSSGDWSGTCTSFIKQTTTPTTACACPNCQSVSTNSVKDLTLQCPTGKTATIDIFNIQSTVSGQQLDVIISSSPNGVNPIPDGTVYQTTCFQASKTIVGESNNIYVRIKCNLAVCTYNYQIHAACSDVIPPGVNCGAPNQACCTDTSICGSGNVCCPYAQNVNYVGTCTCGGNLVDPCEKSNCGLHGICGIYGLCSCQDGWTGVNCQTAPDTCANVNCGAHGYCSVGKCVCQAGYTGPSCSDITPTVSPPTPTPQVDTTAGSSASTWYAVIGGSVGGAAAFVVCALIVNWYRKRQAAARGSLNRSDDNDDAADYVAPSHKNSRMQVMTDSLLNKQ